MNPMEFASKIISLPIEKQNDFFKELKGKLSADEWNATVSFISLLGIFKNPLKYDAVKNAVCDTLCEEIYGHTVEKENNTEDSVLVSMYSNSIL